MISKEKLHKAILDKISFIFDPETSGDLVRMHLIEDLIVDDKGCVSYKFHPSLLFYPIALPLLLDILHAVVEVEDVTGQDIEVVDFTLAEE